MSPTSCQTAPPRVRQRGKIMEKIGKQVNTNQQIEYFCPTQARRSPLPMNNRAKGEC
jgi:hypothetical protein